MLNPILAAFIALILLCVCCFPVFLSAVLPSQTRATPTSNEPVLRNEPISLLSPISPTTTQSPTRSSTSTSISTPQNTTTITAISTQTTVIRITPSRTPTKAPPTTTQVSVGSCPNGCTTQLPGCSIKGNISSSGEKIYHVPGGQSYTATLIDPSKGERWFCTSAEAVANGWRAAQR